jgi:hypothetical protein
LILGFLLCIGITILIPGILMPQLIVLLLALTAMLSMISAWLGAAFWRARELVVQAKEKQTENSLV